MHARYRAQYDGPPVAILDRSGTCSLSHTSSHHPVVLPPLRTTLNCRRKGTMRKNDEEAVLFISVSFNLLPDLGTSVLSTLNFHVCTVIDFLHAILYPVSFAYYVYIYKCTYCYFVKFFSVHLCSS